jgi:hypothetical protein
MRATSIFLLLLTLLSCGANQTTKQTKYAKLVVESLEKEDMFVYVKVKAFLDHANLKTVENNQLFLKGVNAYKNNKNLDSASYYFTESILKMPTNMAYFELGNVFLDSKKYDEAIQAYQLAEQLGYEPFSKVLYNISCVYSLVDKKELAGNYLEYAIQAGYSNIENINTDADLKNLRENKYLFNYHLEQGLKGLSNADNLFWLQFKRQFSKTTFPLKLDENLDILLLNDQTRISYDFEKYIAEMRDEKFSREVSKGFYYLSELKQSKDFVALIYVVKDEFFGDEAPLTFRLVTFTNSGKLIDKKEIAGKSDMTAALKSAIFNADLSFKMIFYETKFQKDVEEEGYYDNPIVKKTKVDEQYYFVNEKGKILKQSAPLVTSLNKK